MDELRCTVQAYAWGSKTAIPELLGLRPTGEPQAELWMGAHPVAPSSLIREGRERTLDSVIAAAPGEELGAVVNERYDGELPFLMKVLAAGTPLSLQAHPTMDQAKAGFAREEELGIPVDAPHRCFKDPRHKPEMICALTPFHALCGFRPAEETATLLRLFKAPVLDELAERLEASGAEALPGIVESVLHADDETAGQYSAAVHTGGSNLPEPYRSVGLWARRLATQYPGDAGVAVALLLNYVVLKPGEAIFLGAGNLHAYLEGTGIELMANSDNVLRGGLTPKHIDVGLLLDVVDCTPIEVPVQRPDSDIHTFDTPVGEFDLTRIDIGSAGLVGIGGPAIVMIAEGKARLQSDTEAIELSQGAAAFIPS